MSNLPMIVNSSNLELAGPRGLMAAMEPYRVAASLSAAFDQVDGDELRDLVRTNRIGTLRPLWDADDDPVKLWRYADKAEYYIQRLPTLTDVEAARQVVRTDIETEPSIEVRCALVYTMLDAWNVTATPTYVQMLSSKLGHSPRRPTETHERTRRWFPTAAIAAAVDDVVTTLKPEHGRPVSIADMLDVAGRHASELIRLETALEDLTTAIPVLSRITEAVADVPRPPSLRPRGWTPPPMDPDEEPLPF
ncbi:hypothetical protein [Bradyrhizobium valentinum]|uniref:Uncharacterized protein n=1 Tax=Bradyrhizobium valentinum TaxID=1518501 RepID=A0A0R3LGA8_9BRAD|nr:hypothetical protein [Bradyrhizobium valentinum]KRR06839.1 hypothetical protein CP49_01665 [Bradyrhizobium valentinum]